MTDHERVDQPAEPVPPVEPPKDVLPSAHERATEAMLRLAALDRALGDL